MKKRRGSALIVALLLLAVVGGLAFSIGRLVFLEAGTAATYENGSIAYFAAESGIEEGFLRYRYDRNAEIPVGNSNPAYYWQIGGDKIYRTNINTDQTWRGSHLEGRNPTENLDTDYGSGQHWANAQAQQIFDLRMGYAGTNNNPWYGQADIGNPQNYNSSTSYTFIAQDNTKKIDLSPLGLSDPTDSLTLWGKFVGATNVCQPLVELTMTVKYSGSADVKQYKEFLASSQSCGSSLGIDNSKLIGTDSGINSSNYSFSATNIDRTIFSNAGAPIPVSGDKVSLTIKPLYKDLIFGLSTTCHDPTCAASAHDRTNSVPGPYTTITSTGYFGGVSRKISANIDRESGTLYDLYDYVLFKGN